MTPWPRVTAGPKGHFDAPPGALAGLAWSVAEYARSRGLAVVAIKASRIRTSFSKHLVLRDGRNRHWHLRFSDHPCPRKMGHEYPHFELISTDGSSGFEAAIGFVQNVAAGEVAWTEPQRSPKRRGQR